MSSYSEADADAEAAADAEVADAALEQGGYQFCPEHCLVCVACNCPIKRNVKATQRGLMDALRKHEKSINHVGGDNSETPPQATRRRQAVVAAFFAKLNDFDFVSALSWTADLSTLHPTVRDCMVVHRVVDVAWRAGLENTQRPQKLGKLLGHGTFKRARLCTDPDTGEQTVVCVVDQDWGNIVEHEATVGKLLNHAECPHIIKTLDNGQVGEENEEDAGDESTDHAPQGAYSYLKLEYANKGDLDTFIYDLYWNEGKLLPHSIAKALLFQLAVGLLAMHNTHGVIHQDLKAPNIFLSSGKEKSDEPMVQRYKLGGKAFQLNMPMLVKVGDLGSAHYSPLSASESSRATRELVELVGTRVTTNVTFFLLGDSSPRTPKMDSFAFGLMMIHLMSGYGAHYDIMSTLSCPPELKKQLSKVWESDKWNGRSRRYTRVRAAIWQDFLADMGRHDSTSQAHDSSETGSEEDDDSNNPPTEESDNQSQEEDDDDGDDAEPCWDYSKWADVEYDESEGEEESKEAENDREPIYDAYYYLLVLFPCFDGEQFTLPVVNPDSPEGKAPAWKATNIALEGPDAERYQQDCAQFSLVAGSNPHIARAREGLEKRNGMDLVFGLCHFEKDEQMTMHHVIFSPFMRSFREKNVDASKPASIEYEWPTVRS